MPITRPNFLGASVLRTNSNIGWGSSPSTFDVTLVEDPANLDAFTYPSIGTPVSFTYESFTFRGLIHKYVKTYDKNGFPTFEVQLVDPRQLLEGAKVIIDEYRLAVTGILNLFNVFGYWENTGYGNSQVNDTGMPWQLVGTGIANICNAAYGSWGGPISYRGVQYGIDMTQLPSLPSYFRISGQSLSILDFIQTVCDAANYDYFITLTALNVITVKTVARSNEYPLGTIGTMLNTTFAGSVLRSADGLEERAETTSTFVNGGPIHTLYQVGPSGIYPFWGFDASGVIMKGNTASRHARFLAPSGTSGSQEIFSYPVNQYNLYVPDIGGITGNTTYTTNDLELQVLLGLGQNKDSFGTWIRYLRIANPSGYTRINLSSQGYGPSPQPNVALPATPANIVNSSVGRVSDLTLANRGAIQTTGAMRLRLVYETLAKYAKDYYGKKWALGIPGIGRKVDTDTGVISYSHEVADGGWVDSTDVTNNLMGLPSYAYDLFQTQDGRFTAYALTDAYNADTSRINPTNTLFHSPSSGISYLYTKAKVHNQIYFDSASGSFVVAEVDPVYDYPDSVVGMSGVVGALIRATGIYFNTTAGATTDIGISTLKRIQNTQQQGSLTYVTHPASRTPSGFEIPLKWNTLSYGPWYAQGASGVVVYEKDNSLVPWNYGGFTNLDLAGNAKASMGISPINVIETGYVDVVGAPAYNIGDVIQANGPNITSIAVSVGKEGVTTTYRFETYVPHFGEIAKYNIDTVKRLAVANTKASAEIKARTRLNALAATAEAEASRTESLIPLMFEGINIRSPHNMLVSTIISSGNQNYAAVSSSTYKESLGFVPDNQTDYNNLAIAPLDSVFSPYAINQTSTQMPTQRFPGVSWSGVPLNSDNLNPYKSSSSGWTTRIYTKGTGVYEEINDDFRVGENLTSKEKRVFGVKGPQVMAGWGYDLQGNAVPGTGSPNYLTDCRDWKVGPIDHLWDDYRKVWTSHDLLKGVTEVAISAGGSGTVGLYQNNTDTGVNFTVYNWSDSTSIASGTKIQFGYNAHDNRWNAFVGGGSGSTSTITTLPPTNTATGPNYIFLVGSGYCYPSGFQISTYSDKVLFDISDAEYNPSTFDYSRGFVGTNSQRWTGDKTLFGSYCISNPLSSFGTAFRALNTVSNRADALTIGAVNANNFGPGIDSYIGNASASARVFGQLFFAPYFDASGNFSPSIVMGGRHKYNADNPTQSLVAGSGTQCELPTYAVYSSNGGYKNGNYGTDSIGNTFAGGLNVGVSSIATVANGTYTVGARLTGGGTDGSITVQNGLITAITQAT